MGKRRIIFTKKVLERWLQEGRGRGEGASYKPWLTVHDFASHGRCHRIRNWHHGRLHHLMSDLEEINFYLFSWAECVLDIREQFPLLPLEETIAIAETAGIKHPADPRSGHPIVITTDFLLKIAGDHGEAYLARTAKPTEHLTNHRILAKFEIERRYWAARNVDWGVVTDTNLPLQLFRNIKMVSEYYPLRALKPLSINVIQQAAQLLTKCVRERQTVLSDITQSVDKRFDFVNGTAMNIVRHLIARRLWRVDMQLPIDMSKPLTLLCHSNIAANSIDNGMGGVKL